MPKPGRGTVSLDSRAGGVERVMDATLLLRPGIFSRCPKKILFTSLMPFALASVLVLILCLMAMALRLSPFFTV